MIQHIRSFLSLIQPSKAVFPGQTSSCPTGPHPRAWGPSASARGRQAEAPRSPYFPAKPARMRHRSVCSYSVSGPAWTHGRVATGWEGTVSSGRSPAICPHAVHFYFIFWNYYFLKILIRYVSRFLILTTWCCSKYLSPMLLMSEIPRADHSF